jgi:hypothetical protein
MTRSVPDWGALQGVSNARTHVCNMMSLDSFPRARLARHDAVEKERGYVPRSAPPIRPTVGPVSAVGGADRLARVRIFHGRVVDAGFVVLGGPLADEYRVVHAVEAESENAVRATLARDPWSETHLQLDTIDPWTIRLDGQNA